MIQVRRKQVPEYITTIIGFHNLEILYLVKKNLLSLKTPKLSNNIVSLNSPRNLLEFRSGYEGLVLLTTLNRMQAGKKSGYKYFRDGSPFFVEFWC